MLCGWLRAPQKRHSGSHAIVTHYPYLDKIFSKVFFRVRIMYFFFKSKDKNALTILIK